MDQIKLYYLVAVIGALLVLAGVYMEPLLPPIGTGTVPMSSLWMLARAEQIAVCYILGGILFVVGLYNIRNEKRKARKHKIK